MTFMYYLVFLTKICWACFPPNYLWKMIIKFTCGYLMIKPVGKNAFFCVKFQVKSRFQFLYYTIHRRKNNMTMENHHFYSEIHLQMVVFPSSKTIPCGRFVQGDATAKPRGAHPTLGCPFATYQILFVTCTRAHMI